MTEGTDPPVDDLPVGDPIAAWAASGAMALTGHADGPPLSPAAAVIPVLVDLARTFARLAGRPLEVDVAQMLTGRAALLGLGRRGQVSANGSCRLLPTADGWAAVNLARPADVESVGALVERAVDGDPWDALARGLDRMTGPDLVDRATLLAIPAAVVPSTPPPPHGPPPHVVHWARAATPPDQPAAPPAGTHPDRTTGGPGLPNAPQVKPGSGRHTAGPTGRGQVEHAPGSAGQGGVGGDVMGRGLRVVDLSAMWAGPLCARLLGLAGLRVVKVESTGRPDGARAGDARFFDWLHGGHASVALDLASSGGRAALERLIRTADVVVESSRPRALAQLGIEAEAVVAARPGVTWVSITGYGREGAAGRRVAFGDDAAAAAGLVAYDDQRRPVFCGDAIADPITGLTAAVAALTSIAAGGGYLVDVPMVGAVAATLAVPATPAAAHRAPDGGWQVATGTGLHAVAPPHPLLPPVAPAHPLGADTAAVLGALVAG